MKPSEEKVGALQKLKSPNNTKKLKSFLGAMQGLAKFLPKFSEKTNRQRKLLKKKRIMELGRRTGEGIQPNKTDADLETMFSALCKRQG